MKKIVAFIFITLIYTCVFSQDLTVTDNNNDEKNILLGLYAGRGYRMNVPQVTSSDIPESYNTGLEKGLFFSGDVTFLFHKYLGIGGKFSLFRTSSIVNNITREFFDTVTEKYYPITGDISDKINMSYLGVYIMGKYDLENAFVYCNLGIGGNIYSDKNVNLNINRKYTAESFGFNTDIGFDLKISNNLSIGAKFSYNYGLLKAYRRDGEYMELKKTQYIDLQHYSFSAGLKYCIR